MSTIILNIDQKNMLQKVADNCFASGLATVTFARVLASEAPFYGVDIPCTDGSQFNYMYHKDAELPMKSVLQQLGYQTSLFGICKSISN